MPYTDSGHIKVELELVRHATPGKDKLHIVQDARPSSRMSRNSNARPRSRMSRNSRNSRNSRSSRKVSPLKNSVPTQDVQNKDSDQEQPVSDHPADPAQRYEQTKKAIEDLFSANNKSLPSSYKKEKEITKIT